jgi:iron complex outermembrane receptor protein
MIPVTLPEIKRIEVLKGPASVLYGFNAFDGVINIITKSPQEMQGTTLQFGGGEYGSITAAAINAGTGKAFGKDFGYRLSYGHDQNNKWSDRNSLAFRSNKFNVQTDYALSSVSKLTIQGGLVDSNNFNSQITETASVSAKPAIGYAYVNYERPNLFIRGWWQHFAQPFTLSPNPLLANTPLRAIPPDNRLEGNTYNIDAQHNFVLGAHRLTYGLNYRHNSYSNNRFEPGQALEDRLGLYLQEEWRMTETVIGIAGIRMDMDTFINPTYSPRVALLYTPLPDHTFRISGGVAYRPPTIFETRTLAFSAFGPFTSVLLGSDNLEPEQMISYELGYQGWYLKHRLQVRTAAFFNHISDLVDVRIAGPTTTIFNNGGAFTRGGGEADIYGGEAGADFLITRWLSGFANFSYQEFGQTFRGQLARGMPRYKANAGLRLDFENGVSGEILYHYYGATTYSINSAFPALLGPASPNPRVGSYNLLNLRGAYRFWRQKATGGYNREAELAVTAFNALNDRHKEHPLGETIGSLVMGWLTVRY